MSLGSFAQQALFDNVPVISPEVNANHTVTFRLKAPNAQKVQVTGDFLAPKTIDTPMGKYDAPGVADMTKDEKLKEMGFDSDVIFGVFKNKEILSELLDNL